MRLSTLVHKVKSRLGRSVGSRTDKLEQWRVTCMNEKDTDKAIYPRINFAPSHLYGSTGLNNWTADYFFDEKMLYISNYIQYDTLGDPLNNTLNNTRDDTRSNKYTEQAKLFSDILTDGPLTRKHLFGRFVVLESLNGDTIIIEPTDFRIRIGAFYDDAMKNCVQTAYC